MRSGEGSPALHPAGPGWGEVEMPVERRRPQTRRTILRQPLPSGCRGPAVCGRLWSGRGECWQGGWLGWLPSPSAVGQAGLPGVPARGWVAEGSLAPAPVPGSVCCSSCPDNP